MVVILIEPFANVQIYHFLAFYLGNMTVYITIVNDFNIEVIMCNVKRCKDEKIYGDLWGFISLKVRP